MTSKYNLTSKIEEMLPRFPEFLMYIGTAILLLDEFLRVTFSFQILSSPSYDVRISIGIMVIVLFAFNLNSKMESMKKDLSNSMKDYLGIIEVLPSDHYTDIKSLLLKHKAIRILTLSGTKTGFLGDSKVREIIEHTKRKTNIIILLANPYSEAIKLRYMNDEPDTYEAGPEGIERRLIALYKMLNNMPDKIAQITEIRVFDSYPTISIIQADDDLYSTTYGYKLRGGDCPKVHSRLRGDYAQFLINHFNKVYADSLPISEWVAKYNLDVEKYGDDS